MRRISTLIKNWLLDFDDTLVSGVLTMAIEQALPRLIEKHQLAYDPEEMAQALLDMQKNASNGDDPQAMLDEFFERMQWNAALKTELFEDLTTHYHPTLFEDALPFLQRLKDAGGRVLVVSNNNRAPKIADALGVMPYIERIYTPKLHEGAQPKPHRSLWDIVTMQYPDITLEDTVFVGDDPWSDGAFSRACGLTCWLVDRRARYANVTEIDAQIVRGLLDIDITAKS